MSPEAKLLAFYSFEGEIIPDSLKFNIDKCFNNPVILFYLDLIK